MTTITSFVGLLSLLVLTADIPGPVAHWNFDEGNGTTLRDTSGNANHASIHGAAWIRSGSGYALQFDGEDDYADCGNGPSLDIRGPVTLSAWVHPMASSAQEPGVVGKYFDSYAFTLYRGGCWWYISGGGNNVSTPIEAGRWHHVVGTFDGRTMRLYLNGAEKARKESKATAINPGKGFLMGAIVADPRAGNVATQARGHFQGMLDEVKLFDRALGWREVIAEYNRHAAEKDGDPLDTAWFDHFRLKPYYYPQRRQLVVQVDCRGVVPVPQNARAAVELVLQGEDQAVARCTVQPDEAQPATEVVFDLTALGAGPYRVRAVMQQGDVQTVRDEVPVRLEPPADNLPDPSQETAPPLPPKPSPVTWQLSLAPGGGFRVRIGASEYPIESSYSFPHGGENRLAAAASPDPRGEPEWQVRTQALGDGQYEVTASGKFYTIDRRITVADNRIAVEDTITNSTPDVLGIILGNFIDAQRQPPVSVEMPKNGSLFLSALDHGLGMIALDDLFCLQHDAWYRDGMAAMVTDKFGLAPGASYTIEWALFPTTTGDHYEFVNAVRKAEGLNRTVEGAFGLVGAEAKVGPEHRRQPFRPEEIQAKGMKYASYFYLIAPADDPGMSLEGIEFTKYPRESALLKKAIAESHRLNPGLKVMFHVAHGLYLTNAPEKLFPDSRVIKEDGRQLFYGSDSAEYYCNYISRERFDQGHRWWIFYPTMENSFGKAMLRAVDFMMDEIGASGLYADGFISGYAQGYTHDRWDGHSVLIDPKTKTVTRKIGNVTYLALPVLREVVRKVAAKGGVVITNGEPGPRSLWKEHYFTTCETSGGDQYPISRLYLGPTLIPFGDPLRIKDRQSLYSDVLDKLRWGALYSYFGDWDYAVAEPILVRHMFPFTLEEIHAGWTKAQQRIVTRASGVYGWQGDRHLHRVYRSDARGILVAHRDYSTVDSRGVRTPLRLEPLEAAVVEKIPVELRTERPVNFLARAYGPAGMEILLFGQGQGDLLVESGLFPVQAGRAYGLTIAGRPQSVVADTEGRLTVRLDMAGLTKVEIAP
ncbi:MAG: LamG domain-containing protein [Rhodopirellula sp.]|nr:LamG domain-containing protein [Rhodopirellula sp.]